MPVSIKKTAGNRYKVSTPGGVKAKHTTKKKAEAQKRLIQAVDHGWKPTGKKAKKSRYESMEDDFIKRAQQRKADREAKAKKQADEIYKWAYAGSPAQKHFAKKSRLAEHIVDKLLSRDRF